MFAAPIFLKEREDKHMSVVVLPKRDYRLMDEEKEVAKELFNKRKEQRTMKAKLNVECTMWDLETVREDSPSILGIWTRD